MDLLPRTLTPPRSHLPSDTGSREQDAERWSGLLYEGLAAKRSLAGKRA
jgi:hypothetical protein